MKRYGEWKSMHRYIVEISEAVAAIFNGMLEAGDYTTHAHSREQALSGLLAKRRCSFAWQEAMRHYKKDSGIRVYDTDDMVEANRQCEECLSGILRHQRKALVPAVRSRR